MSDKHLRDMMMPPEDRRKRPHPPEPREAGLSTAGPQGEDWRPTTYEALSLLAPLLAAGLTFLLAAATGISGGFGGIVIFSPWVAAGLILLTVTAMNFSVMTITWAFRVYGAKGFLGAALIWMLLLILAP